MPKSTTPQLPLSALFGIVKPSGPASMAVINDLKHLVSASKLFMPEKIARENARLLYRRGGADGDGDGEGGGAGGAGEGEGEDLGLRVDKKGREKGKWKKAKGKRREVEAKMGQGGTLDPLADGVLVVGVNRGTKKLSEFLDCVKEYRTTCLLGCETDSYDSTGAQVRTAPWRHVTRDDVEKALEKFRGEILQTPPIFSALKMDGKPLYEYARQGIPLPRPIERRQVTIHALELTHWIPGSDHPYDFPEKKFSDEERERMVKALRGVEIPADGTIGDGRPENVEAGTSTTHNENQNGNDASEEEKPKTKTDNERDRPPAFVLRMRVSGGTYVRSIVHDLGHALGSAAHVVTLTRAKQGRFVLSPLTGVSTPVVGGEGRSAEGSAIALGSGSGSGSIMATDAVIATATDTASCADSTSSTAPFAPSSPTPPSEPPKLNPKETKNENDVESNKTEGAETKTETETETEPEIECIPWAIFAHALENRATIKMGADGWRDWEREVLKRLEVVEA